MTSAATARAIFALGAITGACLTILILAALSQRDTHRPRRARVRHQPILSDRACERRTIRAGIHRLEHHANKGDTK